MCLCSHSLVYNSFLDMCVLLTYLSGLSCPPDCLILILLLLFFFVRKGRVLGPGLSVSCFSLLPLDGVCALFSDTPFWPGLVSRCSSSRTKDHAIAESDRSDRNQYRNQSESCVLRDYSGREFVTVVSEVGLSALRLIFVGISL